MPTRSSRLGDYLRTRRDLVQPEDVGLDRDASRRVKGLRRQELAALAGISAEYYLRLEQGRDRNPSDQVVRSLARALRLDDVAAQYLARLAHERTSPGGPTPPASTDRLRDLIGQLGATPAYVTDANLDVVLANPLAERLGGGALSPGANRVLALFSERARAISDDWEAEARAIVGALRMRGNPDDRRFQEVIGRLSVADLTFRSLWAAQHVSVLTTGSVVLETPEPGVVRFDRQDLRLAGVRDRWLTVLTAAPGSAAEVALAAASRDPALRTAEPIAS